MKNGETRKVHDTYCKAFVNMYEIHKSEVRICAFQVHNISRSGDTERDIVYSFSHTHTVPAKVRIGDPLRREPAQGMGVR